MRKLLLIFLFPLFISANRDSLLRVLKSDLSDSLKINALSRLITTFEYKNGDSAALFAKRLYDLSVSLSNARGLGEYNNYLGRKYYFIQSFDSALIYFRKALSYYEKAKAKKGIASARNNIAAIYMQRGDFKNCLKTYRELVTMNLANKLDDQLSTVYANIAYTYATQTMYDSAIYYNNLSLKIHERLNLKDQMAADYLNLAVINANIKEHQRALQYLNTIFTDKIPVKQNFYSRIWTLKASIYRSMKMLDSSETYIKRSIQNAEETNDKISMMGALSSYAQILAEQKKLDESEKACRREVEISEQIDLKNHQEIAYHDLAQILMMREKYQESIEFFNRSIQVAVAIHSSANTFESIKGISQCYMRKGDLSSALIFLDSAMSYNIHTNEAQKFRSLMEIETRFETEKKDLLIAKTESELKVTEAESKRKTFILIIASSALAVSLFFGILALINFRKAKKFSHKVQEQNSALATKNIEIEKQKQLVEEKQHEIISSINYAQRIQSAVLTGEDVWKRISKEYFILFQPKDIVSGDFYWAHVLQNGRAVFAVADCTGHGVPGGFMSMLGNSFLNEIVVENKIFSASKILNKLREKIIKALEQKGHTQQQDGMDIALCVWNKMDNSLEFAGANNNLYIARKGGIKEIKGNKMPIGTYVNEKNEFESQTIQLEKGDTIYLTTDGFVDQFGGPKARLTETEKVGSFGQGKKYKYSQLETVLQNIQDTPLEQQAEILKLDFENWKGSIEQTDDVCVVGVKV